jgi:hypothetical protein
MQNLPANSYGIFTDMQVLSIQNLLDALDYAEGVGDTQEVQLAVNELVARGLSHLVLD